MQEHGLAYSSFLWKTSHSALHVMKKWVNFDMFWSIWPPGLCVLLPIAQLCLCYIERKCCQFSTSIFFAKRMGRLGPVESLRPRRKRQQALAKHMYTIKFIYLQLRSIISVLPSFTPPTLVVKLNPKIRLITVQTLGCLYGLYHVLYMRPISMHQHSHHAIYISKSINLKLSHNVHKKGGG